MAHYMDFFSWFQEPWHPSCISLLGEASCRRQWWSLANARKSDMYSCPGFMSWSLTKRPSWFFTWFCPSVNVKLCIHPIYPFTRHSWVLTLSGLYELTWCASDEKLLEAFILGIDGMWMVLFVDSSQDCYFVMQWYNTMSESWESRHRHKTNKKNMWHGMCIVVGPSIRWWARCGSLPTAWEVLHWVCACLFYCEWSRKWNKWIKIENT